ncbi:MAG: EpsI family protein [Candidatus Hydrogenedentes bacterium]|nr:EpsI family protein [Candidatus Hydrogenedentota bacterium]
MLKFVAPLLTLGLLTGVVIDNASRQKAPEGVDAYHANVREAMQLIPYVIGDWVGTDTEIRQEALKILDANSTLSRVYRNLKTGRTVTMLLVQCADARSLLGHYPPVCYPSQGWSQLSSTPRSVATNDGSFEATEYVFGYDLLQQSAPLDVLHFTVLPDGRIAPDMQLLDSAARDRRFTFYGGASIQFIVSADLTDEERMEVYESFFEAAAPWIAMVQSGTSP